MLTRRRRDIVGAVDVGGAVGDERNAMGYWLVQRMVTQMLRMTAYSMGC